MDPISFTASIVNIAVLTTNILKLVQNLSSVKDPSVKLIRAKLMGERRKFANWMLVMRISNLDDLQHKIQPGDYEDVKDLVWDLQDFFREAEEKIRQLNLQAGKSFSSRAKALAARFRWMYGSLDDLRLLVETLEALNSTLYAIAEPPPKYGMASGFEAPLTRPDSDSDRSSIESHNDAVALTESRIEQQLKLKQGLPEKRPILNLYQECLKALTFISSETKGMTSGQTIETVVFRLKIWALDFVDGSYPLDFILAKEEGEMIYEHLRTAILGTMVDMALIEEQFLGFLSRRSSDYNSRRLEELQLEVVVMLGTVGIVIEHSSPVLNEEDPGLAIEHAVKFLASAVNSLYDLLPALRTLRREQVLEEERQREKLGEETEVLVSTKVRSPRNLGLQSTGQWLDQPIKSALEIETLLLKQEQRAHDAGKSVDVVYSQLFKKERERLQEWRDAIQRRGETTLGEEKKAKVKHIVSRFEKGFTADIPKSMAVDVEMSTGSKFKKPQPVLDEKMVKQILDSLSNAADELRQI